MNSILEIYRPTCTKASNQTWDKLVYLSPGRNREIFQGGQSQFFSIFSRRDFSFFPVKISILVDPKKFQWFPKIEKQQQKKKGPQLFQSFVPLNCSSQFPPLLFHFFLIFHFSSFSSTFSVFSLLYLPSFFQISRQKLSGGNFLGGALCPVCSPPVTPLLVSDQTC